MEPVSAVLFAKDLKKVAAFYSGAMGAKCTASDNHHSALSYRGFRLIIHQIPDQATAGITHRQPPERRTSAPIRLEFPVQSIASCRAAAKSLGGQVDDTPPSWAGPNANVFLGHDPEGNVFAVSEHAE